MTRRKEITRKDIVGRIFYLIREANSFHSKGYQYRELIVVNRSEALDLSNILFDFDMIPDYWYYYFRKIIYRFC